MKNYLDYGFLSIDKIKKVYVYGDEGPVPHCHVVGLGSDGSKEVCVRLDTPEYFCHGDMRSIFTENEKQLFVKFVNMINKFNVRHWDWLISTWNGMCQEYTSMKKIHIKKIPDYSKLSTED